MTTLLALLLILSPFAIPLILLIVTIIKKKKQVGKTWEGFVSARLQIQSRWIACTHCENDRFYKREGILATSLVSFFRCSCWNQSAICYTCTKCGHIDWFLKPIEDRVEIEIK